MTDDDLDPRDDTPPPSDRWLDANNTWTYLLPMVVFMLLGQLEPTPTKAGLFGLTYDHYPAIYAFKLACVAVTLWFCRAAWGQWRWSGPEGKGISPLAIVVGVVGLFLWIGCSSLNLEGKLIELVGGPDSPAMGVLGLIGFGERSSFNPLKQITEPANRYAFIFVRMLGLTLFVPLFEELMLRGWLMRTVISPNLWRVPFGRVTTTAILVGTAFPMLTHPEKFAAMIWFSLVTWLMVRTKNFWDCVTAHAITNFLLGVYVLWFGAWHLW
ncbi:CAAX amino terminal protease self- immunity [Planctomycetes bacterium MalM25]|nr:CAAX amino terminal protease self- immunity [Planctomycetes bacterium MalM25]